jgi:hypothetical protein
VSRNRRVLNPKTQRSRELLEPDANSATSEDQSDSELLPSAALTGVDTLPDLLANAEPLPASQELPTTSTVLKASHLPVCDTYREILFFMTKINVIKEGKETNGMSFCQVKEDSLQRSHECQP